MPEDNSGLILLLEACGAAAVVWWIVSLSMRAKKVTDDVSRMAGRAPHSETPDDYAGRFRIDGVDQGTKMDTVWYVDAASADNARAKATLEGIIVTKVTREA